MLEYIKGSVEYIYDDAIVVENNGIGYKILTSTYTVTHVSLKETICIYTYMYANSNNDDSIRLFGFLSMEELSVFKILMGVNGVGPVSALSILSILTVDELRLAVLSEDYKTISKAKKIGLKTAQMIVIKLKDKFKLEDVYNNLAVDAEENTALAKDIVSETAMALTSLGYTNVEALRAIKKISGSENMSVEELLKKTLKVIN